MVLEIGAALAYLALKHQGPKTAAYVRQMASYKKQMAKARVRRVPGDVGRAAKANAARLAKAGGTLLVGAAERFETGAGPWVAARVELAKDWANAWKEELPEARRRVRARLWEDEEDPPAVPKSPPRPPAPPPPTGPPPASGPPPDPEAHLPPWRRSTASTYPYRGSHRPPGRPGAPARPPAAAPVTPSLVLLKGDQHPIDNAQSTTGTGKGHLVSVPAMHDPNDPSTPIQVTGYRTLIESLVRKANRNFTNWLATVSVVHQHVQEASASQQAALTISGQNVHPTVVTNVQQQALYDQQIAAAFAELSSLMQEAAQHAVVSAKDAQTRYEAMADMATVG